MRINHMRKKIFIDIWFSIAAVGFFVMCLIQYRLFSDIESDSGTNTFGAISIVIGISFAIFLTNSFISHRKNILRWILMLVVMWYGGFLIYYPFIYRKWRK